jgi:hypothetical protein
MLFNIYKVLLVHALRLRPVPGRVRRNPMPHSLYRRGHLSGWLAGLLTGWLAGWLAGWPALDSPATQP